MESEKKIALPDGKALYYVHTTAPDNKKVIVHIHGLSGWPYEVASTAMAQQFPQAGYDVVRPYLYHWLDDARKLHETTIAISAADVDTLIDELAKSYEQIFVTGHSYGGPCTMQLRQDRLSAISLWDPSYIPANIMKPEWMEMHGEIGLFKGYFYFLMSQAMIDEGLQWDLEHVRERSRDWLKPLQVIHAEKGNWVRFENAESFHTNAAGLTDYHVIEGTVHCFVENDTTQQLLEKVRNWFDQF